MLRITNLARMIGASVDELRYLERKGFINPVRAQIPRRKVRQYQDADVRKLQLIIKFRRQGFTWDAAFKRAMRELESPSLFDYG
jgi:DNA-binding transcriptional MerR regulator